RMSRFRNARFALPLLLLAGCAWIGENTKSDRLDPDGDGVLLDDDCDDQNAAASTVRRWFADSDEDGFGDPSAATDACTQPDGYIADATDCDDADPAIFPSAIETCTTEYDDNCDSAVDDGADAPVWFTDSDTDGYGDPASPRSACDQPTGTVADGTDCDDANFEAHPLAEEACDSSVDLNCDGYTGATDADGDGWIACDDCDDGDLATYPGAGEICDAVDNDCDGEVDDDPVDPPTWYTDADGDSFVGSPVQACEAPTGSEAAPTDCDDADPSVSPNGTEACGGADEDCDGLVDDADPSVTGTGTWYADDDADTYGAEVGIALCVATPGLVADNSDCDDTNAEISPLAEEICAAGDEDCDGLTDDDDPSVSDGLIWFEDSDGDAYGAGNVAAVACVQPAYTATNTTDCDDSLSSVNPGGTETCGTSYDDDCDGDINDLDATDCTALYADIDNDGYGAGSSECRCQMAGEYTTTLNTDCDDANGSAHPGATETCDTAEDDNCDGDSNDIAATMCLIWFLDADRDGYGSSSSECRCAPSGSYDNVDPTDCDDARADVYPDQAEIWYDGVDSSCDGGSDYDQDSDGYDVTPYGSDCDDVDRTVSPGAAEICNDGIDNNCDGGAGSCVWSGTVSAMSSTDAQIFGFDGRDMYFGYALAVGPIDSSGPDDLLIGAPGRDYGSGAVYQFLSVPSGSSPSWNYSYWLYDEGGDQFGYSVALVDDDASPEIAVGQPLIDYAYAEGGSALSFAAPSDGFAQSNSCARDFGAANSAQAGSAVVLLPDLTGDGEPELFSGAPLSTYAATYDGVVTLHSLTSCDKSVIGVESGWYGAGYSSRLGTALAAGDVTGDGVDDIVAGAPGDSSEVGGVYVLDVTTAGYASAPAVASAVWQGVAVGDLAGSAVAVSPDVDGDGLDDIVIGAPGNDDGGSEAGAVYVVSGGSSGVSSLSAAYTVVLGSSALGLGASVLGLDLDSDGFIDLAAGAPSQSGDVGWAYLFQGPLPASLATADAEVSVKGYADDALGASMASGDLNDDGRDDWVIGAYNDSYWGYEAGGAVYVLYGKGM
ncbi:MAG: hypothetical protein EXR69_06850, partial [Myxococcales bacterium]|nr:hypothetical protein [Myxococcales bacterium]